MQSLTRNENNTIEWNTSSGKCKSKLTDLDSSLEKKHIKKNLKQTKVRDETWNELKPSICLEAERFFRRLSTSCWFVCRPAGVVAVPWYGFHLHRVIPAKWCCSHHFQDSSWLWSSLESVSKTSVSVWWVLMPRIAWSIYATAPWRVQMTSSNVSSLPLVRPIRSLEVVTRPSLTFLMVIVSSR